MADADPLPYEQVSDLTFAEPAAEGATVRLEPDDRDPDLILLA